MRAIKKIAAFFETFGMQIGGIIITILSMLRKSDFNIDNDSRFFSGQQTIVITRAT